MRGPTEALFTLLWFLLLRLKVAGSILHRRCSSSWLLAAEEALVFFFTHYLFWSCVSLQTETQKCSAVVDKTGDVFSGKLFGMCFFDFFLGVSSNNNHPDSVLTFVLQILMFHHSCVKSVKCFFFMTALQNALFIDSQTMLIKSLLYKRTGSLKWQHILWPELCRLACLYSWVVYSYSLNQ